MNELWEHCRQLLGLDASREVSDVNLCLEERRVEITLQHAGGRVVCPECGTACGIADHAPERTWRHLDTMQFETVLKARVPRAKCGACGAKTTAVPWAGKYSRFTLMFEAFAIEVIQACGNVKAAAGLLRLDWDSVHRIMERAVERGLKRRDTEAVRYVGIDEKSFRRGQSYVSLLKEQFRWFWEYRYAGNAKKFFSRWYGWAARSRLKPVVRVAKMLKRHLENILTYFRHGITNSMSEGFNSRIQSIKSNARGFRAFTNFRTRILFYCGKLDLTPPELSHNIP